MSTNVQKALFFLVGPLRTPRRLGASVPGAAKPGAHHFLPHLHSLLAEIVPHGHRVLSHEPAHALLELFLLLLEEGQVMVEELRKTLVLPLGVVADEVLEIVGGEQRIAFRLLLNDDLQQDASGDVLLRLGVDHLEFHALHHHAAHIAERDVLAFRRIVDPAVGVLLYDTNVVFAHDGTQGTIETVVSLPDHTLSRPGG